MKKALFISTIIFALTTTVSLAQNNKVSPADTEPSTPRPQTAKTKSTQPLTGQTSANATGNATANAGNSAINAGTALSAELQSAIDVRRSKVGDQVVLKTVRAVKQNGQTIVPKGTQLVGRITEIAQRSKNNSESRIGMIFDRIQGGRLSQPITASIVSITSARTATSVGDDLFSSDMMSSSSTSASASRGSGSGGSLLGGTGGLLGGATSTVGGVTNTATSTVGGVANTATQTAGSTTQGVGKTLGGLRISGSANSSTTLSSGDKNLHIEKGATFNLIVNN